MKKGEVIRSVFFTLFSCGLYIGIVYFTPRENFVGLLLQWETLFLLYGGILWWLSQKGESFSLPLWTALGIGFRLIALFALPLLSDDYYRFIWDGTLLAAGENPFLELPINYLENPAKMAELGLSPELYAGLNSKEYFTIYPPVLQFIFWLGATLAPRSIYGAVLWMKLFVFAAELGTIYLLNRWIRQYQWRKWWSLVYVLNPLVIVELCGNLHFEALMIFFLLLALVCLTQRRWLWSSVAFSLAVTSKLLPLIVLPLLIRRIGWKKTIVYGGAVGVWSLLQFLPLFDSDTFLHIQESINLYVSVFEFNASIWYVIREVGQAALGYNVIRQAGPILSALVLFLILDYSASERMPEWKYLPKAITRVYFIYFAFASIVHPWYVVTLVAFGSLTTLRFPVLWSALIPLSYIAYQHPPAVTENYLLIALEYVLVFAIVAYESRLSTAFKRTG